LVGMHLIDRSLPYATPLVVGPVGLGCLLAIGWQATVANRWIIAVLMSSKSLMMIPLVFLLDTLTVGGVNRLVSGSAWRPAANDLAGVLRYVILAFIVARCIVNHSDLVGRMLNTTVLTWLGQLSYSLYLWQQLFLSPSDAGLRFGFPVDLIGLAAIAALSFYLIERPALKFRRLLDVRPAVTDPRVTRLQTT
jgi:peptidoglycan/LPS O-acetylase OafA/YrhL